MHSLVPLDLLRLALRSLMSDDDDIERILNASRGGFENSDFGGDEGSKDGSGGPFSFDPSSLDLSDDDEEEEVRA